MTVHTHEGPGEEEWRDYISQVRAHLPLEEQRALVISAGGSPNGKQRKMMVDELEGAHVPVAILTNSFLMRSASTAVSWFNPQLKVFGPHDLDSALDYLGLTAWERTESRNITMELQRQLGIEVTIQNNAATA